MPGRKATGLVIAATAGIIFGSAVAIVPEKAAANPYWAQQTGQPCATCHYGGRETEGRAGLNPTGQAFLACGYHFAGPVGGCPSGTSQGPQPYAQPQYQYQYPSPSPYQPYYTPAPPYQSSPYYSR